MSVMEENRAPSRRSFTDEFKRDAVAMLDRALPSIWWLDDDGRCIDFDVCAVSVEFGGAVARIEA